MSGRQVRTRSVTSDVQSFLEWAKEEIRILKADGDMPPEIEAIEWPDLLTFPREETFVGSLIPRPIPDTDGLITDFKPRKGKRLQRWKNAEYAAELVEIAGSGYRSVFDNLEEAKEAIDADEEMGLKEQLDKINAISEFQEELIDFQRSCEDCAATIRAIRIPNRR